MSPVYEWDEVKAAPNLAKHGVSFLDATEVFEDLHGLEMDVTRAARASCDSRGWASLKGVFWRWSTRCAAMRFG